MVGGIGVVLRDLGAQAGRDRRPLRVGYRARGTAARLDPVPAWAGGRVDRVGLVFPGASRGTSRHARHAGGDLLSRVLRRAVVRGVLGHGAGRGLHRSAGGAFVTSADRGQPGTPAFAMFPGWPTDRVGGLWVQVFRSPAARVGSSPLVSPSEALGP